MVSMQSEEKSPSPQPAPTPQCVGREFVRQYYTLLAETPKHVHRFYGNESIFVHGTDTEEVVGQTAIQNKIRDMSFEECRTRIRALDAHETLGKGVVVQVVGEISVNSAPMRRFVQTFVLAPQSEKKYYVHNDIFRYEDELWEKIAHENGDPADPDAEKPAVEQAPASAMSNGEPHFRDEIDKPRSTLTQYNASIQAPSQHLQSQVVSSSGFNATTTTGVGSMAAAQSQAGETGGSCSWNNAVIGNTTHAPAPTAAPAIPAVVPNATAPMTNPQPLPQRPQQQSYNQASAPPNSQSSVEPPPEPSLTSIALEQSSEKPSPVPSEEREETVDTGTADKTWAGRVKQKPGRGSSAAPTAQQQQPQLVHNNQHHQQPQQQPAHATEGPGTSAPATLSPTAGPVPPSGNYSSAEFGNRQHPPQHYPPPSRPTYQHNRAPRQTHGPCQPSQDVRQSGGAPAPAGGGGGGGGGHHGGFSYGGGGGKGPVATFPNEQQAYIRNIPVDADEDALKELLESSGYNGIAELLIRRKLTYAFAFVAFDAVETAHQLIQKKNLMFGQTEIAIDAKRPMTDRPGGGNFPRPYPGNNAMVPGGGANIGRGGVHGGRGGGVMMSRGGSGMNRPVPQGPGGYVGRQAMPSRTFQNTVRGGGVHNQHSQQQQQ